MFLSDHYVRPSDERNNFSKTNYYFSTLFCRSVTFKSLPGYLSLIQARLLVLHKELSDLPGENLEEFGKMSCFKLISKQSGVNCQKEY